jgi:hypothetical protein
MLANVIHPPPNALFIAGALCSKMQIGTVGALNRETLLFAPNACFIVRSHARCMSADFLQPESSLLLRPGAPVCALPSVLAFYFISHWSARWAMTAAAAP